MNTDTLTVHFVLMSENKTCLKKLDVDVNSRPLSMFFFSFVFDLVIEQDVRSEKDEFVNKQISGDS